VAAVASLLHVALGALALRWLPGPDVPGRSTR
jgi:hypothetical protein